MQDLNNSAQSDTIELKVNGIHCSGCATTIETHLKKLGLADASVDFSTQKLSFTQIPSLSSKQVIGEITKIGYTVENSQTAPSNRSNFTLLEKRLAFSLIWSVPLVLHMFVNWRFLHNPLVQLALCLPVYSLGLIHFGRSALGSLRVGVPNMDVLIFIGITASFIYSLVGTIFALGPDYLFYETSASIISLVLFGNLLEERSVRRTTSAIQDLAQLQPTRATRIKIKAGLEQREEIKASEIKVGDILLVNSGDTIPTDSIVESGAALINESIISGESAPLHKTKGESVIGGSLLLEGNLQLKASAVGAQTVLAEMIRLVQEARKSKAQIQRLADQISAVFVPCVLLISALTLIVNFHFLQIGFSASLLRAIAVLVIACPCAMGLATPTAVMVGLGLAAKSGILIKGANTLEQFASIKRMVFDKTGTLTNVQMQLSKIICSDISEKEAKDILLSLEHYSSHPIARSIVAQLNAYSILELKEVQETRAAGISAKDLQGNQYQLGSRQYTSAQSNTNADLFLLKNSKLVAEIWLEEKIKAEAKEAIQELQNLGLQLAILSGDTQARVQVVAAELGITEYYAEKKPDQKLALIESFDAQMPNAFVGDGINDAASLEKASVGISLSDATQAAINSAQVVLLNGRLNLLVKSLKIARKTLRTIKQNLFWAFFYNTLAIPLAAAGYLNPMIAALAMAFSDVIVIGNSLRLRLQRFD